MSDDFLEGSRDGWMRSNNSIVPHDCNLKRRVSRKLDIRVPGDRNKRRFRKPRFGIDDCPHKEFYPFEACTHGTDHARDGICACHRRAPSIGWDSKGGGLEAIDSAIRGRVSDTTWVF